MAFQKETKKDNILDTKSKETHLVHCPKFPSVLAAAAVVACCCPLLLEFVDVVARCCSLLL